MRQDLPLVIAANRDEHYARPSTSPILLNETPRIVGGLDRKAGGTWLGVNEHGLLVGLTNQRTYHLPDPTRRSRGNIVLDALKARNTAELCEALLALQPADYNPFNLLFGDGEHLFAAYSRPEAADIEIEIAPEGVHVLPNDRIGSPGFPKTLRARAMALPFVSAPWPELVSGLTQILGDHQTADASAVPEPPPDSIVDHETLQRMECMCLHGKSYGTCSSAIVGLRPGAVMHYLYADGPACVTPFSDVVGLLR